ncbi:hypothetical protein RHMOL_Rhmol10G0189500 [Rhododendron molle]|uniref:Uncharacterized protein n=1 Tax=Rhododendron molle TaxID=49168 RepID=A0ACC0M3Y2_RHOML|nr:hypothetical protein RHMOL_Rhmol10G0189500 [Rhododendron molle]
MSLSLSKEVSPKREHQCIVEEDIQLTTSLPLNKEATPEGNTNTPLRKISEGTVPWPRKIHRLAFAAYLKEIDDKLTSLLGGITRREHQCVIKKDFQIATSLPFNKEASPKREHQCIVEEDIQIAMSLPLSNEASPEGEHQCIIEEEFRRDNAIANGDPSTGACRTSLKNRRRAYLLAKRHPLKATLMHHKRRIPNSDELTSQQGGIP